MSIIGAIADLFRAKPPTARQPNAQPNAQPSGGQKAFTLKDLVAAAQQAATAVNTRADWLWQQSQARGGRYLSLPVGSNIAMFNLTGIAQRIPAPQGVSYAALVKRAAKFDADYAAMVNGWGWAATPNSGQIDNMAGLQQIAAQLEADALQLSAMATAAQAAQPRGGSMHAPALSPAVRKMARKVAIQGVIDEVGPAKAFEVLGEDIWDAWE